MIISDLVADREVDKNSVNVEKWCSCIDGPLTEENYLGNMIHNSPEVLQYTTYLEDKTNGRIITSLVAKAIK